MNTTELETTIDNASRGLSGSQHYVNESAQKAHELMGVPYQANYVMALFDALNWTKVGITIVELNTGELLFGHVNDESQVPTNITLKKVSKLKGIKSARFVRKAVA